ncbi:MAG: ABC transporter substrate-binding protein [Candidatus Eutrophobiaceae bacterium]
MYGSKVRRADTLWRAAAKAMFLACLALSCSCGQQAESEELGFGLNIPVRTLDPRFATDAASARICRLIYRSLVDFDSNYRARPDLASWEHLNGQRYRFTLGEQGREFHHGGRLTARDVKATYESMLLNEGSRVSPHRGRLENILEIVVIDEDTVDFVLSNEDLLFPEKLNIGIMPADLLESGHSFGTEPIGSGGIRMLSWDSDVQLRLRRLRDGKVIALRVVKDPTVRALKLVRGELDLFQGNIPPELLVWLKEQDGVQVHLENGNLFTYIGFNMQDPVTKDARIRKAIAHAIDRQAIVRHILQGTATLAETMLVPRHWAHAELPATEYDPDAARRLLDEWRREHGHPKDWPIEIGYKTSSDPLRLRIATVIQHQLGQVGIEVGIHSYDWGTFYGDIKKGRFQMYSLSWVGTKTPDIYRYAFHSESMPPQGANRGRLDDARVDTLIETAERGSDLDEQAAHYRKLQSYLHDLRVYIPLWHESQILVTRHANGYVLGADGNYDGLLHVERAH